ncbi:hypothetical protein CPC08DRAFT_823818 [Agrocybe pediades]|nr:hypothetical protein CPC08DRAFT_823818 [Agrocybe pediades]
MNLIPIYATLSLNVLVFLPCVMGVPITSTLITGNPKPTHGIANGNNGITGPPWKRESGSTQAPPTWK